MGHEFGLALFERNGIHHRFALHTFEARYNDVPLGGVNHDRNARNVRLRGNQIQEGGHGIHPVEHALVHVHVQNLGPSLDLVAGDVQGLLVLLFLN